MYLQKPRRNFRKPLEDFTKTIGHPLMFNVCKYFFFYVDILFNNFLQILCIGTFYSNKKLDVWKRFTKPLNFNI